ncbi:MAG TPA: DivIVA domain-containing protein [Actinomycetota bacterium]|nr:DivIVA domain-containing protein [Actinomycetota bacterium]
MMAGFSRLTAQQINDQTFARALRGYAMHEVDGFLDRAAEEIARWHEALNRGRRPNARLLTPREVSEVVFNKEVRGYDMAEVDDFLDELAAELARLYGEVTRRVTPAGRRLTADDIVRKEFNGGMRGYDRREVDRFLDQVAREVLRWQDALAQGYRPSMRLVTPQDINEKVFTKAVRGYAMIEVDAFLDELTDELAYLQDQDPQASYYR